MTEQKPSIGRIVHYFPVNAEECENTPNPAVVTRVYADGTVDLHVLGDLHHEGPTFDASGRVDPMRRCVPQADFGAGGTWRWPPRA